MNELLLVVAGIFVLCILVGVNRGFIKIVASLFATLIILVLVVFTTPYVGELLVKYTPLDENIQEKCSEIFAVEEMDTTSRDVQIAVIEQAELPEIFKELLLANNNTEVYESLGVTTFVEYIGTYFAKLVTDIAAFLLTFLAVTIVVRAVLYILGIIGDLPVIGGINRLAGGALGIGTGVIIVWILFIVITVLYDMSICKLFLQNIEDSEFLQFLYDNNVLINYVTKFRS